MKVSICCVTYNQEQFVAQALNSLLMQQTSFDFNIIVGDDCSTDGTQTILLEYEKKFPEKFIVIYNPKNLGIIPNLINVIGASKSEYIAFCAGDDYWTDSLKLQKQIDFLDQNPDFILCSHHHTISTPEEAIVSNYPEEMSELTGRDLAQGIAINGSTALLRNFNSSIPFPTWVASCPIDDWAMFIYLAQFGKIYILKENMSVYRFTRTGVFSSLTNERSTRNYIETINVLLDHIADRITRSNLKKLRVGQYIKLLSLYHQPQIDKKTRWSVLKESRPFTIRYNLKQYRYMMVYLFDLIFSRKKFNQTSKAI